MITTSVPLLPPTKSTEPSPTSEEPVPRLRFPLTWRSPPVEIVTVTLSATVKSPTACDAEITGSFVTDGTITTSVADDGAVQIQPVNSDPTRLEATINLPLIEKPTRKKTTTDDPSSPNTLPPIQQLKEAGNQFFIEDLFDRAIDKYSEALRKSVSDYNLKGHPILYSNRAQCYLKRGLKNDPYLALLDCLAALEIDPLNMKAHFRVLTAMNRLDYPAKLIKECINDFSKIHEKKKETREILIFSEVMRNTLCVRAW